VWSMRTAVRSAVHPPSAIGESAVTYGAAPRSNLCSELAHAVLGAHVMYFLPQSLCGNCENGEPGRNRARRPGG
jgi:hypothetical protein